MADADANAVGVETFLSDILVEGTQKLVESMKACDYNASYMHPHRANSQRWHHALTMM